MFSDQERILRETLRESAEYEAFRSEMFQSGLKMLRKERRGARPWMRWAMAACLVFGIGLGVWSAKRREEVGPVAGEKVEGLVASRPLAANELVRSAADERLFVQTRSLEMVEVVKTEQVPLVEMNDRDLLALFGDQPVGFVQHDGKVELVVVEPN